MAFHRIFSVCAVSEALHADVGHFDRLVLETRRKGDGGGIGMVQWFLIRHFSGTRLPLLEVNIRTFFAIQFDHSKRQKQRDKGFF